MKYFCFISARRRICKVIWDEEELQRSSSTTSSYSPFERSFCWGSARRKNGIKVSLFFSFKLLMYWNFLTFWCGFIINDNNTQVLVIPSGSRDVHHTFIYPTPPFEEPQRSNQIHMMTDPCVVNVSGVSFGITSTDILFHLGKVGQCYI